MDSSVLQTIEQLINSQGKLEIIHYFQRNPYTWESLAGLAQRLHRSPRDLELPVRELVQDNLLMARVGHRTGNDPVYNYHHAGPHVAAIGALMAAYEGADRKEILQAVLAHDNETRLQSIAQRRALDDLRTRFVSMVTHELRTPVTVLKSVLATLSNASDDDPERVRWLLQRADSQCDRLSSIVENLLVLSGLQTGRDLELYLGDVEIPRLIAELRDRFLRENLEHSLEFVVAEAPETLVADEYLLGQMLEELIQNAIKFSPEGGLITLTLRADGAEVVFEVQDPGMGMAPWQLERAFEPFYQAEGDAARLAGGLGIGLFMARHIAEAHGGRIWIEAKPPPGLQVCCALPLGGPADAPEV